MINITYVGGLSGFFSDQRACIGRVASFRIPKVRTLSVGREQDALVLVPNLYIIPLVKDALRFCCYST